MSPLDKKRPVVQMEDSRKNVYAITHVKPHTLKKKMRSFYAANDGWSVGKVFQAVPDEDISLLLQIGETSTMYYWYIGDMANKWILEGLPNMWVYKAVAELVGKSSSSVRNYAYLARRFNRDIREQYGILRFDHFIFAMKCDAPMDVIAYAAGVADERGGKPASVDELEGVFKGSRRIKAEDEEIIYGAKPYWPAYTIPMRRKLLQIENAGRREQAEKLLIALCELIEAKPLVGQDRE